VPVQKQFVPVLSQLPENEIYFLKSNQGTQVPGQK